MIECQGIYLSNRLTNEFRFGLKENTNWEFQSYRPTRRKVKSSVRRLLYLVKSAYSVGSENTF